MKHTIVEIDDYEEGKAFECLNETPYKITKGEDQWAYKDGKNKYRLTRRSTWVVSDDSISNIFTIQTREFLKLEIALLYVYSTYRKQLFDEYQKINQIL